MQDLPDLDSIRSQMLVERLRKHPHLHARIGALLDVVENSAGDAVKADQAEQRVAEELRQMGQEALQAWAERKQAHVTAESDKRADLTRKEKKGSTGIPVSATSKSKNRPTASDAAER